MCDYVIDLSKGGDGIKQRIALEDIEQKKEDEAHPFYSFEQDKIVTFVEKVVELEKGYNDTLMTLAGYKGETLDSLERRTLGQMLTLIEAYNREFNGRRGYKDQFRA